MYHNNNNEHVRNRIKQPNKYTHSSLNQHNQHKQKECINNINNSQQADAKNQDDNINADNNTNSNTKTKLITKNRKKIKKPNEPSALRLQAINNTFYKIQQNTSNLIQKFNINKQLLSQYLSFSSKTKCKCNRNIKYYCLKCMNKNQQLQFPTVKLPMNVIVLHHQLQKINKSSIIPMALLSDNVKIEKFKVDQQVEQMLNQVKKQEMNMTYILFPHKNSRKVSEIPKQQLKQMKNIVVLDCTWFQTDQLISCLQKKGYTKFIRLQQYQSLFWRYNHYSQKALSSGQALAYFLRQYQGYLDQQKQENIKKYDQIMFLYFLNLKIVEESYRKQGLNQQNVEQKYQAAV